MSLHLERSSATAYSPEAPKTEEGAGGFWPSVSFLRVGQRRGNAHGLERRRRAAGGAGAARAEVPPLSAGRSAGGRGDGRFAASLGSVVAASGVRARRGSGIARRLQATGGGAAGGRSDESERAGGGGRRADRQGGDPGLESGPACGARVGRSVDRAGAGPRRRLTQVEAAH